MRKQKSQKQGPQQLVTVCGYGSLLSRASCLRTCPNLRNFRYGKVMGYVRVFSMVSINCMRLGYSNTATEELAVCAAYPVLPQQSTDPTTQKQGRGENAHIAAKPLLELSHAYLLVTLFDIDAPKGLSAFHAREHRYDIRTVPYTAYTPISAIREVQGNGEQQDNRQHDKRGGTGGAQRTERKGKALLCVEFENDEEYIRQKCGGDGRDFRERVRPYYEGPVWGRSNILPVRHYLSVCLRAAAKIGEDFVDNFLDYTFLSDHRTTMRQFLYETQPTFLVLESDLGNAMIAAVNKSAKEDKEDEEDEEAEEEEEGVEEKEHKAVEEAVGEVQTGALEQKLLQLERFGVTAEELQRVKQWRTDYPHFHLSAPADNYIV
eukprot:TRINITY_DN7621_c0_g1_i1.p1 TRINITY_DN7621_c0_g1~~TRINITY_DN7621_c0_g1_i1.p1  ORF type:complete len:376 (+),score=77.64 TRINITY_DN7621_c0_g1_i1:137-1264(+)